MTASILLRRVLANGTTVYERVDGELIQLIPPFIPPAARREESTNHQTVPGDAVMKAHPHDSN